ncbi:ectonucleotide pyrophosphatase/phosphodiesterase [Shewanella sp. 3_MG-2023]|uniref:alkaline phosphatase family protein n=1 Tax=Shewanella sp. 3_MG-2023 TaxID=3062635 RepID=UPI0026E38342|nr:ectonucleotide pyrophosphatase/phosphodiesterase [Shewanella sp. 3_MG-2023]MDO6776404.1 ectonucleotide pyrophosphatase/phosphodiesterase [Shewanella sp. 3_MG-2023]
MRQWLASNSLARLKQLSSSITIALVFLSHNIMADETSSLGSNQPHNVNDKPYVLLISIDGYRHDYNEVHQPKFLNNFASNAATITQLTPSFPTVTFPNHLTLVTGLYPSNHGIVANRFYNPTLGRHYALSDHDAVTDGRFYTGVPLWSLAAQQGMKSATYFWPGSEAEIAGFRPTYWKRYDGRVANETRVEQVIEWLKLPETQRPQFVTLYFSEVDSAGHHHGPLSQQTHDAVNYIDKVIASLIEQVNALPYAVNIIITSDHGMAQVADFERIYTDKLFADDEALKSRFSFINDAAFSLVRAHGNNKDQDLIALEKLVAATDGLAFYRKESIPKHLEYDFNPAIGDAILVTHDHYITSSDAKPGVKGKHGYYAEVMPDMNAIFYANGPAFNHQAEIELAKNIHVYPLIAHILNLSISEPIDGKLDVLSPLLKQ